MLTDLASRLEHLAQCCYPFCLLSGHRQQEALDAVRVYDLDTDERLVLQTRPSTNLIYVLEGEVICRIQSSGEERHLKADRAHEGPTRLEPAMVSVELVAQRPTLLFRANGEVLDYLLGWETLCAGTGSDATGTQHSVAAVRRSLAFQRLPLELVEEAFRRMQRRVVKAGEVIVRQGEPGDAFYIIERGRAEVWQTGIYDDEPQCVGQLGPGDPFGEEALVLKGSRNATVSFVEDGSLLVLGHEDFDELFHKPLINRVSASIAQALISEGHQPLDVRYEEEYAENRLASAIHIPLHELRRRVNELDKDQPYVVYCKSGGRSAVGTLLLRQRGFQVVSIEGGLRDWPYTLETD